MKSKQSKLKRSFFGGISGASLGKKPSNATEATDTGKSTSSAVAIEIVSAGDIEGLSGGKKGIFLNKTPLQNADNSLNFQGVKYAFRRGTQNQSVLPDYAAETASETQVGTQVKKTTGIVGRTIYNSNLDLIRVRFGIVLYKVNKNVRDAYDLEFRIETKEGSNAWAERVHKTIKGKFTSETEFEYDMPVRNYGGQFDTFGVRVTVISDDESNTQGKFRSLTWKSYTEVIKDTFNYSNSAVITFQFPSELFQSIPERSYRLNGKVVRIPSNATVGADGGLTFSGAWDGTLYKPTKACSDPAWQLYHILTDSVVGLGKRVKSKHVDLISLYNCSVYNNQLVPDGLTNGVYEKRFLCNTAIQGKQKAVEVINALCSAFHVKGFWAGGKYRFWQDRPRTSARLFTQSDVAEGEFLYSTTDLKSRYTQIHTTWNDPTQFYEREIETVEDADGITRYGINEKEIVAFGCDRRSQAIREGNWHKFSALKQTTSVTFVARAIAAGLLPGDVIEIADEKAAKIRYGGLVVASTTSSVTLDSPVSLVGSGFQLKCLLPDGTTETRTISQGSGNYTTLTVTVPFSLTPQAESNWIVSSTLVNPQKFQIINIATATEPDKYEITAVNYIDGKWDEIELGIDAVIPSTRLNLPPVVTPPSNVVASSASVGNGNVLSATFTPAQSGGVIDPTIIAYKGEWSRDGILWQDTRTVLKGSYEVIFEGIQAGNYQVRVASIDTNARESIWVSSTQVSIQVSPALHPDTNAYLDKAFNLLGLSVQPNQIIELDNFVKGVYANGLKLYIDECYPFLVSQDPPFTPGTPSTWVNRETDQLARLKLWKFPGSPDLLDFPIAPGETKAVFTSNIGIGDEGFTNRNWYVKTGVIPLRDFTDRLDGGGGFGVMNAAIFSGYISTSPASIDMGVIDNNSYAEFVCRTTSNQSGFYMGESANPYFFIGGGSNTAGLTLFNSASLTDRKIFLNGSLTAESTGEITGQISSLEFYIGATNNGGSVANYSRGVYGFISMGQNAIPLETQAVYNQIVLQFLKNIGRNSIT